MGFKFFSENIKRTINRRPRVRRPSYSSFSYLRGRDEINFVFVWLRDDIRGGEYRLCMYEGRIEDFGESYDNMQIEDNEILFMTPIIESIHIHRTDEMITDHFNYEFLDPNEIVTIFFKVYTNA